MNLEVLLILVILTAIISFIVAVLCIHRTRTQEPDQLTAVGAWLDQMQRLSWTLEELDNETPIDYVTGEVIARKRMEKLALANTFGYLCRIVIVFAANDKQYKCSGIYGSDNYILPKGEWFATIAKEALRRNGFVDARIIAHIVMSPEA